LDEKDFKKLRDDIVLSSAYGSFDFSNEPERYPCVIIGGKNPNIYGVTAFHIAGIVYPDDFDFDEDDDDNTGFERDILR
jgi:hypothetical protein